jgi:apolipoprotein N-acyltransferase
MRWSFLYSICLTILSFCLVAFGQPAYLPGIGIVASLVGFALFFRVLLGLPHARKRFFCAFFWFAAVQGLQLSWLLTHPYSYIYGLYFFLLAWLGAQFGIIGLFITQERLKSARSLLAIAGLFTILEWSRLFVLSGFPFNPVGLSMTGSLWGLQAASIAGVYGLTFWVIVVNLFALRLWMIERSLKSCALWVLLAILPYAYGYFHIRNHVDALEKVWDDPKTSLSALLVQTAFPIEEQIPFTSWKQAVEYAAQEWDEILKVIQPYQDKTFDLIALPEEVVPYSTYLAIYPYTNVENAFVKYFGENGRRALPELKKPLAMEVETQEGRTWQVTNAYYCQTLANLFASDLIAGLQDDQWVDDKNRLSYSSAFYFWPNGTVGLRYEKRVLLPIAEFIPLECCKGLAKDYGISGSFTPGIAAKAFPGSKAAFGLSICYEEAFGHLMRGSRLKGADLLINVTSDVWYPNSRLPKQHFDHARLRTVENGVPLIRACNTGITAAIDSLGRILTSTSEEMEWMRQAIPVQVPLYHYRTLYSQTGDWLVIGLSLFSLLFFLPVRRNTR